MAFTDRPHYLRLRGRMWWLKLPIPADVQQFYGITHIEESLRTRDREQAGRKKHGRIAYWMADFDKQRRRGAGGSAKDITEAHEYREALRDADERQRDIITSLAAERAREIEQAAGGEHDATHGPAYRKAKAFYDFATRIDTPTLREAFAAWMQATKHTAATEAKYQQALDELLRFMEKDDALPQEVTDAVALRFADWLNTDAKSTRGGGQLKRESKKSRIVALSSLWSKRLEPRGHVPRGSNPWRHIEIPSDHKPQDGKREDEKRPYTDDELMRLLHGPELREGEGLRYTKRAFLQLYALGLFTGARLNELCERTLADVESIRGGYILHIRSAKTKAGIRSLPVYHPIPVAILRERIGKRKDPKAQLFAELIPGGPDNRLSWQVQKALGRYRDKIGLGTETDFHSTRRNFAQRMEALKVFPLHAMRYVGHKPRDITFGLYSQVTDESLREVARRVSYSKKIEAAFRKALDI